MGAKLQYAKIVDRDIFMNRGGRVQPGLPNQIMLHDEPGRAGAFLVLRGWCDDHGTFTEQWRLESPGGEVVYESLPREVHLATRTHVEKLEDEVSDLDFQYGADDYSVVFTLDDREVARLDFAVRLDGHAENL